ncbi:MAG: hypothetical protein K0Q92_3005 [Steroidobacteraceae bacterium]|jgi:hypothetical protein|nr:hypothetical protein [Steroidobacteraceae bacterium]
MDGVAGRIRSEQQPGIRLEENARNFMSACGGRAESFIRVGTESAGLPINSFEETCSSDYRDPNRVATRRRVCPVLLTALLALLDEAARLVESG